MGFAALNQADDLQPQHAEMARVYVVDDDSAVREAVSMLVRTCGWEAVPCEHVDDFFVRYAPAAAQCLIVDLRMPGRSGLDLQRELRRRGDPLPVIVVTAHSDHPEAQLSRALGARAVLGKPFNDDELLRLVREALDED